ncbi:MAG TPA: outer membrane protein transport protein [Steroidobacteraceae bacterium]
MKISRFVDGLAHGPVHARALPWSQRSTAGRTLIGVCVAAASLGLPAIACASGFALLEQSASRLGTAFSGTAAAADDASTVFYNPAGLMKLSQAQALLVASGVQIGSTFHNVNSQAALGQSLGSDGGDAGGWSVLPAAYFALPVNSDLAFGLALNVPFGLQLDYDNDWIGRFQSQRSQIETYNINPAVAWRLNPHVSLGFGLNYQRVLAELTNAVNYTAVVGQGLQQLVAAGQLPPAAVPGLIAANGGLSGATKVRGDDSAWGFNAGVLFEFSPDTRLGLAYRSSTLYTIEGSVNFAPPTASDPVGAGIIAAASATGGPLSTGPISVDLELPEIATASFYHRMGNVELLADVAWTGWSSVQELRIVRDSGDVLSVTPELWKDTWRYALGATYALNDMWKLRGGVAFDQSPVPDSTRTTRLPDAERKWVAIGVQWTPSPATAIDVGYAHLFSDDVTLNQDEGNAAAFGLVDGRQESDVNILSVQLGYKF